MHEILKFQWLETEEKSKMVFQKIALAKFSGIHSNLFCLIWHVKYIHSVSVHLCQLIILNRGLTSLTKLIYKQVNLPQIFTPNKAHDVYREIWSVTALWLSTYKCQQVIEIEIMITSLH